MSRRKQSKKHYDRQWMPVSPLLVDEEKYSEYRDRVMMLSLGIQIMKNSYESEIERKLCTGASDKEIANILDLEEWEVTKIRTVAETEAIEQVWNRIAEDNFDFKGIVPSGEEAEEYYRRLMSKGVKTGHH